MPPAPQPSPAATILQLWTERRSERARLRPEDRLCWICCDETGVVTLDDKELCLYCGCELLTDVLLPRVEPLLGAVEKLVADEVLLIEEREKSMSPPDSPKTAAAAASAPPTLAPDDAAWTCYRCTLINKGDEGSCLACGSPRPLQPECLLCGKNYITKILCRDMKPHKKWKCGHCDTENIEQLVECRACRKARTWFCAMCSMENPMGEAYCLACDGKQQLSSLKSFVNRKMMARDGLSVKEMEAERRNVQEAAEHKERLEHRLGYLQIAKPVHIADDGNCLFRAMAFQLVREESLYPLVRHIVVEQLVSNADHYSAFVGEAAFAKYADGMRQSQVWGDELCVHAASRAFNVKIHVITSDEKRWRLVYARVKEAPSNRNLLLAYRAPNHYYTMVPKKDAELAPFHLAEVLSGLSADAAIASHIRITLQASAPPLVAPPLRRGQSDAAVVSSPSSQAQTASSRSQVAGDPSSSCSSYSAAISRPAHGPGAPVKTERPSTATRGSRGGDFLQLSLVGMLQHAVVVTVRIGSNTNMALCVGGDVSHPEDIVLGQKSSFFYLHNVPREAILLAGPSGIFGSIYTQVLEQATSPQKPRHPRPQQHPLFLLQEVSSGSFLGYRKDKIVRFAIGGGMRNVSRLCCYRPHDLSDCVLTISEARSTSTNELRFYRSPGMECPYLCETGKGDIIAVDSPTLPTPFLVQLIFAGRCERLCVVCHQWYVPPEDHPPQSNGGLTGATAPPLEIKHSSEGAGAGRGGGSATLGAGSCRHMSHADALATMQL